MYPPVADAQDMLQLMRRCRGRMQGNVSFRHLRSSPAEWTNAYCFIDTLSGALLFEQPIPTAGDSFDTLVQNLRGCKVCAIYEDAIRTGVVEVLYQNPAAAAAATGNDDDDDDKDNDGEDTVQGILHLRPDRQTYFNSWYAAFLCWQCCQPGQHVFEAGIHPRPALRPAVVDEKLKARLGTERYNAPLRTERALLLLEGSPDFSNIDYPTNTTATEVFCVVRGNGQLSIHSLKGRRTLATIQLHDLPRSAFARLHKSVFGLARTLAIYPQYARSQTSCSSVRPIFLSFNYTDSYELLFVLFRAFALPECYLVEQEQSEENQQPQPITSTAKGLASKVSLPKQRTFRLEHSVSMRVNRAKLRNEQAQNPQSESSSTDFYVELLIDEQIKAKTSVRIASKGDLFWAEIFDVTDLPATLSSLSFRLKRRHIKATSNMADMSDTASIMTSKTGMYVQSVHSALDTTLGVAEVDLNVLHPSKDTEMTLSLHDGFGADVGALAVKVRREEHLVLMEEEYEHVLALLQTFANGITLDISERTPLHPTELANRLLNVFQSNGTAEVWLRHLIRDEIYNARRHIRRQSRTLASPDDPLNDPAIAKGPSENEVSSRTHEALVLFRGNTLLSRALDSYMRRVGQSYLETTLRVKLQDIADADEECEVDPSKLEPGSNHKANWQRLIRITKEVWSFIRYSAFNCPPELRRIFRTIRDCAADRYGSVMPSKAYTSVSSFLFLRFFCAAIITPRLFGLLKSEAGTNAQRTYMLVAKSLQGLANMSTFGNKEHWMAPMNAFCSTNRRQFENFINIICDIDLSEVDQVSLTQTLAAASAPNLTASAPDVEQVQTQADPSVMPKDDPNSRPSSTSTIIFSPVGLHPPDSRPMSPSDFNTAESVAYTSSFATEIPLPIPGSHSPHFLPEDEVAPEDVHPEEHIQEQRSPSLVENTTRASSRQSVASYDTAIYVGTTQTSRPQSLIRKSLQRASLVSSKSVDPAQRERYTEGEQGDETSIYESAIASPELEQFESASSISDADDDAVLPDIAKSKERPTGLSKQQDAPGTSQSTEAQTAATKSARAASIGSLRSRPSLDLPPSDPLRLILEHLPPHAREGLLTLPGLIDPAKNLALLVNLWLGSVEIRIHRAAAAAAAASNEDADKQSIAPILRELDDTNSKLAELHHFCLKLKDKANIYRAQAEDIGAKEKAESIEEEGGITASSIAVKWVSIAERMEASPHEFWRMRSQGMSLKDGSASSVDTATMGSDSSERLTMSSRDSVDTMRSGSTTFSAAPPPPAISRDPRSEREANRSSKPSTRQSQGKDARSPEELPTLRRGWGRFTGSGGGGSSAPQSSRSGYKDRNESRAGSMHSSGSGSDKTSTTAPNTAKSSSSKKSRRRSPERTAEQTAMRKLGWM